MKLKTIKLMSIFGLSMFFIACSQPEPISDTEDAAPQEQEVNMDDVRATIQEMENRYAEAHVSGDMSGILDYYAEEAVSYPAEGKPLMGKQAIIEDIERKMLEEENEGEEESVEYEIIELINGGDHIIEVGRWTSTDLEEVETGIYWSVFKMIDGRYQCIRDTWNTTSETSLNSKEDDEVM